MKNRIVPTLIVILMLSACLPQIMLTGSGNVVQKEIAIADLTAVEFHSLAGELIIEQGEPEGLTLQMDDNLMPYFQTTAGDGVLTIEMKVDFLPLGRISPVRLYLTVKDLKSLEVTGLGSVTMQSLATRQLAITSKTAEKIQIENLQVEQLKLDVNGLSVIDLSGSATNQEVHLQGSGVYQAGNLHSQNTVIRLEGLSEATVWADASLHVTLADAAVLSYYGKNPQLDNPVSGIGNINFLGLK